MNHVLEDYIKKNQTCLDCDSSTSNCTDVGCSSQLDINGNPYQCLSEEEAQNWHKKCLPSSENYCRYTGSFFCEIFTIAVQLKAAALKETLHLSQKVTVQKLKFLFFKED